MKIFRENETGVGANKNNSIKIGCEICIFHGPIGAHWNNNNKCVRK